MKYTIAVLGLLLWAGLASAQCPVALDTWANPSDDGKGDTVIFYLHRNSTNTDWNSGPVYPNNPNVGPINAAADTYEYKVEFGAINEGYITVPGVQGSNCRFTGASLFTGLSVKDLTTGVTTNFAHEEPTVTGCADTSYCKFDYIDIQPNGHQYTMVSGHSYQFFAGREGLVTSPDYGTSGNYTASLKVNVQ